MNWSNRILENKRILISGASSGIGQACAVLCSQLGAGLILMGRDESRLQQTLDSLEGTNHTLISCELTDVETIKEKLSVLKQTQPISGFIHSAGVEYTKPLRGFDYLDYEKLYRTNVSSAIEIAKIISGMGFADKNGASYVLISSISAIAPEKGKLEYATSKSALMTAAQSLAMELAAKNIRVNSITPAVVMTPMVTHLFETLPEDSVAEITKKHKLGLIEPSDIANTCAFLLSDLSSKITGTNLLIDSGYLLS